MLESLLKSLAVAKGKAVEAAARAYLNRRFEHYGSVTALEIDARNKTIRVELALKGETVPIVVSAGRYELIEESGAARILFHELNASREWIRVALNEAVAGRAFPIPAAVLLVL